MNKIIHIESEKWKITINNSNELSFSYIVPYERSIYATNPLWHSWDDNQEDEYENYVERIGISKINIFKIKSVLLREIAKLIKQTNIKFFYFYANTHKKNVVYRRISKELVDMLDKGWTVQFMDEWYYFHDNNG